MSNLNAQSIPLNDADDRETAVTTPGSPTEVKWEIVAQTFGLTPATIIAGRLQAENIPARAWQEGAGRALGLTVGILGTGYVAVPEEYVEKALEILEEETETETEIE